VTFLEKRREVTGEAKFSFETRDFGFRHAVLSTDDGYTIAEPGNNRGVREDSFAAFLGNKMAISI